MNTSMRYHSVRLNKELCKGCTNCLMHCPTEAIRVRKGRAHILDERCIDCGECIRICDYHAKVADIDTLEDIKRFRYRIALPAPTLYGQFRNINDPGIILKNLGFDDVLEVARGADIVSKALAEKMRDPDLPRPMISSACPAVVRLIQVRFPDLIPNIVNIRQPMEVAAEIARAEFVKKHACAPEEVGVFFITPCPAKMTVIHTPLGQEKSAVDGAISIMEVYGQIRPRISKIQKDPEMESTATSFGIGWATSSGEAKSIFQENALNVDGIQNVSRVLEEIENNKLSDLAFFEGNACVGGCVGGPLTFENNYVAKNAIRRIVKEYGSLDVLPETHPRRGEILSLLRKHVKGLAALQHHDGYWHQLLDRNDTYLESSATAIYAYCLAHAVNRGWVSAKAFGPVALMAWHAVAASVNDKGQVENTCVGTGMGFDASFYAYRPVHVMAAHGYGPVIWAGAEIINLLKQQHPKLNDSAVQFYDQEVPTDKPIFNYDGSIRF